MNKVGWVTGEGRWEPEHWRGEGSSWREGERVLECVCVCVCIYVYVYVCMLQGVGLGRMRDDERGRIYKYVKLLVNLTA